MLLPNDEQDAALIEIDGSNAGRSAWSAWSAVSSMCDVAPSNHAGGGRGTPGEGKESATEDDDREERGGKFLQSAKKAKIRGKIAKTPVFSTTLASLNRIVLYSYSTTQYHTVHSSTG